MNSRAYNIAKNAKAASHKMSLLGSAEKNQALKKVAQALLDNREVIIERNKADIEAGIAAGLSKALIDRLTLNDDRIKGMAEAVNEVAAFKDPVGEVVEGWNTDNGMAVNKIRVPLGVLLMIYEARPNVTIDAAALSIKSGNAIILKGGKEANNSNAVLAEVLLSALKDTSLPENAVQLFIPESGDELTEMMQYDELIDTVIPRGGVGLKKYITANSKVPVIVTGAGVCHVYVDKDVNPKMARDIVINSKTHRPGVCNAAETLLLNDELDKDVKLDILKALMDAGVELVGDEKICALMSGLGQATEEDWSTEYLDMKMSVKTVSAVEEAIEHINNYGSGHSETIVSESYDAAEKFMKGVDAAAVYTNASTRFTDGGVFGFGGEIGISTQKLHARGPMGVRELTTCKYVIRGTGQIR